MRQLLTSMLLDEQRDEIPDRAGIESRMRTYDCGINNLGRQLRKLQRQPALYLGQGRLLGNGTHH